MTKYEEYLDSPQWARKRAERIDFDSHMCQLCAGTENLSVHHISYENLGDEDLVDLITVCCECHELLTKYVKAVHRICDEAVYRLREEIRKAVGCTLKEYAKKHPDLNLTNKEVWNRHASLFTPLIRDTLLGSYPRSANVCQAIYDYGDLRALYFNKKASDTAIVAWRDEEITKMRHAGLSKKKILDHFSISDSQYAKALQRKRAKEQEK